MLFYCLKYKEKTDRKTPKFVKTKNGRIMVIPNCAVCNSKKSRFIKEQRASGLLSSLEIKETFKSNSFSRYSFALNIKNERNSKHVFICRR